MSTVPMQGQAGFSAGAGVEVAPVEERPRMPAPELRGDLGRAGEAPEEATGPVV